MQFFCMQSKQSQAAYSSATSLQHSPAKERLLAVDSKIRIPSDDTSLVLSPISLVAMALVAAAKPSQCSVKKIRKNSKQAQQQRVNDKFDQENNKLAFKKATKIYEEECQKEGKRLSASKVVQQINDKFNTSISSRTVLIYVREGRAGQFPLKKGPVGHMPQ